jgi:hypothetical protein
MADHKQQGSSAAFKACPTDDAESDESWVVPSLDGTDVESTSSLPELLKGENKTSRSDQLNSGEVSDTISSDDDVNAMIANLEYDVADIRLRLIALEIPKYHAKKMSAVFRRAQFEDPNQRAKEAASAYGSDRFSSILLTLFLGMFMLTGIAAVFMKHSAVPQIQVIWVALVCDFSTSTVDQIMAGRLINVFRASHAKTNFGCCQLWYPLK